MNKKNSTDINNNFNIENLKFFYGVPHCHTTLSTGKASPSECIELAYKNDLDFIIITDHNSYFTDNIKLNKWSNLNKLITKYNKKYSNFLILQGFETHTKSFGHLNIINSPNYFLGTIDSIESLIIWCSKDTDTIVAINHPNNLALTIPYSETNNNFIKAIELGNGIFNKKYTKHDKIYYSMLDRGWKLAAINSQDNHKLNIGKEENLTCVISNSLSNKDIVSSLKNHFSFSTESKSLKMFFTINMSVMGSTLKSTENETLNFFINTLDINRKISKLQIITSNNTIVKELLNIDLHTVKFMFEKKASQTELWYVVKVVLNDKREGITSPIFIDFN